MSGQIYRSQVDMRTPPTEDRHLVRWQDMVEYVVGKFKNPVRVVMTANFIASYNTAGLKLTQTTPAALVVDGVTLAVGDKVLLTGQSDKTQNGIYEVEILGVADTTAAVLVRADDFDESAKIIPNVKIPIVEGTSNHDTIWVLTTPAPITLDTTNLEFAKDLVDVKRVVELTFKLEGDDVTDEFTFSHNLDTLRVTHELYDSDGETVYAQFKRVSANDVKVILGAPLETGDDLTLIIRAEADPI